jgi:hypothetical protein
MAIGYSWGAGHGVMQLGRALGELGLTIDHAVLADPIYRHPWLPSWLQVRSLLNWVWAPTITVPAAIRQVRWCRQIQSKPMAHNLKRVYQRHAPPADRGVGIEPPALADGHDHLSIDESAVFRRQVYETTADFVGLPRPEFALCRQSGVC